MLRKTSGLVLSLGLAAAWPAAAETFTYDALGRLVRVAHDDGRVTTYAYDAAGNRTSVTVTPAGASAPALAANAEPTGAPAEAGGAELVEGGAGEE